MKINCLIKSVPLRVRILQSDNIIKRGIYLKKIDVADNSLYI